MGKDLTCYVEVRDHKTKKWKIAPVKVEWVHYVPSDPEKPYFCDKAIYDYDYAQPWIGRDYELFDVLDGTLSNSIAPTRGLPIDLTNEVLAKHEEFKNEDGDGYWCFNETWYTLAELEAAASDKKKYPKWEKWRDDAGIKHKEVGVGKPLREYVRAIQNFVNLFGYYNSVDVRVIMWWDW